MENVPSPAEKPSGSLPADQAAPAADENTPEDKALFPQQPTDDAPDPDEYDTLERRRFGPVGAVPSSPWLTVALCLAFVGLLIYGAVSGNGLAFALVAVVAVFVGVPYLLLYLFNGRRLPPRSYAPLVDDESLKRPDDETSAMPTDASVQSGTQPPREPLDGALPAAGLGEPNTGNGHKTEV